MTTTQETNAYSIDAIIIDIIERARREWNAPSYSQRAKVRRTHTIASLAQEIAESSRLLVNELDLSARQEQACFDIELQKAIAML